MASKEKIIFFCHGAGNGGAERVITTIASEFAIRGYETLLITTNEEKNDYKLYPTVKRKIILSVHNSKFFRTIDRIIKLRKCIKEFNPKAIISFSAIPNIQLLLATLGTVYKTIISERTDPNRYPKSLVGKLLRSALYPCADAIVFQTQEAREYFGENIARKGIVIPNPLRDDLPNPYNGERKKKIIGVGSLGEQKNWHLALCACSEFFAKHPDYTFDIFGEGPYRDSLQETIENNPQLRNRVTLKGFSSNVLDEMLQSRMYLSSSDYEGISNAMLEALAIGVPTICTDCPVGGSRAFINNGVNGILVPTGDYVALSDAMITLAEDDHTCKMFSENSISVRASLNLALITDKWEGEVSKL